MGAAEIWRHEVGVVEVGQCRVGMRQTVMSGENLSLVGRLLGQKRHRTTAGYAHLADAHLVKAKSARVAFSKTISLTLGITGGSSQPMGTYCRRSELTWE